MKKPSGKKLLIIIPLALLLICAIAIGVMYFTIGRGGVVSILSSVRLRTDMMQAAQYEAPDGFTLPYRVYVPKHMDEAQRYPVVLFLQGAGHSGTDNRQQTAAFGVMHVLLSPKNRAKYPCILIAPQAPDGHGWSDELVTPALMGILEQTAADYPVDSARIYVTGLSMGGFGTWGMLAAYPDYFAAGAPICGGWDVEDAPLLRDIPIWAFHGAKDPVVDTDLTRNMVKALEDAGSTRIKYTEYPNEGHWSWGRAYYEPALYEWMFAQTKAE